MPTLRVYMADEGRLDTGCDVPTVSSYSTPSPTAAKVQIHVSYPFMTSGETLQTLAAHFCFVRRADLGEWPVTLTQCMCCETGDVIPPTLMACIQGFLAGCDPGSRSASSCFYVLRGCDTTLTNCRIFRYTGRWGRVGGRRLWGCDEAHVFLFSLRHYKGRRGQRLLRMAPVQ